MQSITHNGSNGKIYGFFKQYIFRGMHLNDVKFTHNIYYIVLHGMMEGFNKNILKIIMWNKKKTQCFLQIMYSDKSAFTRAIFVCRFMTATKLGGRSNEQRST